VAGAPEITSRERAGRHERDDALGITSLAGPRRRRPTFVVFGLLLMAASGLVGALLVGSLTTTVPVLAAAADLEPGQVVTAGDLRVVELSELGSAASIAVDEQATVIGLAARGPVPAGTILNPGLFVAPAAVIPDGMAVVGATLEPGAAAGSSIRPGDRVDVLGTSPPAAGLETTGGAGAADVLATGTVWGVEPPAPGSAGRIVVTLLVPAEEHAAVAQAASDDRLRLARVPG
jgi:pilus assembly protein CpaB